MNALSRLRRKLRDVPREEALTMIREACAEYLAAPARRSPVFSDPKRVGDFVRVKWGSEAVEVVSVLFLDTRHRLIRSVELSRGTVDRAAAFPREVVRQALAVNAAALILTHNHPSGDPAPSDNDRALTREVGNACAAVGVRFLDHVVSGREGHFSFAANGLDLGGAR